MTLIAAFMIENVPVLIGDILISSSHPLKKINKTPTGYKLDDLKGEIPGINVVDVAQKITIIGETCAIAWAGTYIEAVTVIRELTELNELSPLSYDSLSNFFKNDYHEIGVKNPLSFIGFVKHENTYKLFEHNAVVIDSQNFGEVIVTGSGHDEIKQLLTEAKFSGATSKDVEFSKLEPSQRAITKILGLIGPLFNQEMSTAQSINKYYGGGYEISTTIDDKPTKVEDIAYTLSLVIYDKKIKGYKIYLSHIMKYEYEEDILCIYSLECFHDTKKYNTFMLKPMSRYISSEEKSWYGKLLPSAITPEFRYSQKNISCLIFCVEYPNGKTLTHTLTAFEPWSHFAFQVKDIDDGDTEITLHEQVTEALTNIIGEQIKGKLEYT